MLPASSKGGGQTLGFPDVCKTPAPPAPFAPIPYPNIGMVMQAVKTAVKVKFSGKQAVTKKSEMSRSQGDEAGTMGGMISGQNMAKVTYKMGSKKVKAMGQPVQYLGTMTGHNGANANMPAGNQIVPSQVKVLVAP